jgi:hypothetical protein
MGQANKPYLMARLRHAADSGLLHSHVGYLVGVKS